MTDARMSDPEAMKTLCGLFQASVQRYPNNVLVRHLGRDWTYREIWTRSTSLAYSWPGVLSWH